MSYEHDFLSFCLSCDERSTDGPYCSQACRLADLEKSGSPDLYSSSPASTLNDHSSSSWRSSSSGLFLPPAVDFSALAAKERPTSFAYTRESMSRSSSVSSTGSAVSSSSSSSQHTCTYACMSESTRQELRHYESLFDQTRHRSSYSSRSS